MFVLVRGANNMPGHQIENWTIVESPYNTLMACSPDGLFVGGGIGYEFKTKDFVKVPQLPEEILDCEFLQCQTCLSFCRDFVWAWILCYNRLDTGEFKAYLIVLDEDLWANFLEPAFEEFVQRSMFVANELLGECTRSDLVDPVDFEEFFDQHKYPSFQKGYKQESKEFCRQSKNCHVYSINFK